MSRTDSASRFVNADSDIVEARFLEIVPDAREVQAVDFVPTTRPLPAP